MVCNLAGDGLKFEICLEMCSPGPKDTSKSPECYYSMRKFDFIEISKILFFTYFSALPSLHSLDSVSMKSDTRRNMIHKELAQLFHIFLVWAALACCLSGPHCYGEGKQ